MTEVVQARFDEGRLQKMKKLQEATGLSTSQLFRRLIDAVEVEPARFTIVSEKVKSAEAVTGKAALFTT